MKRQFSESSIRHKQQHIYFTIPITRYFNRANNKKSNNKIQLKLEILKQRFIVKEETPYNQWTPFDVVAFDTIDKIQDKEKTQEKYTLLKIQFNNVPEKEKEDKAITFRMQDIAKGREMSAFIKNFIKKKAEYLQNALKSLNYIKIGEREQNTMKYIIEMENQYNIVFRKAIQKSLFPPDQKSAQTEFQRILLNDHPQMKKFQLLKHTLKYQQQKNILLQKLNLNAEQVQKQQLREKQLRVQKRNATEILAENSSNINMQMIEQDLAKISKEGREAMEGYSSKNEFEGVNVRGGDEELYQKVKTGGYDLGERNESLILGNIKRELENEDEGIVDEMYSSYGIQSEVKRGMSERKNPEKMEIEDGEIEDNHPQIKSNSNKYCQKLKIPQIKDIRLQQKREDFRHQAKKDIKFIDPSYDQRRELTITKQAVIWCRLFYHYLKEGGIEKREHELTVIENELKRLKHGEKDVRMNEAVGKMVDKAASNFLKLKRGQDLY